MYIRLTIHTKRSEQTTTSWLEKMLETEESISYKSEEETIRESINRWKGFDYLRNHIKWGRRKRQQITSESPPISDQTAWCFSPEKDNLRSSLTCIFQQQFKKPTIVLSLCVIISCDVMHQARLPYAEKLYFLFSFSLRF